jgi:hypothetical protein
MEINFILCVCENFCDTVLLRFRNRNKTFWQVTVPVPFTVSQGKKLRFLQLHTADQNLQCFKTS